MPTLGIRLVGSCVGFLASCGGSEQIAAEPGWSRARLRRVLSGPHRRPSSFPVVHRLFGAGLVKEGRGARFCDRGRGSPDREKLVQSQDSGLLAYRPAGCPQGEQPPGPIACWRAASSAPIPDASMNVTADMSTSRCAGPGPVARASRMARDVAMSISPEMVTVTTGRTGMPVTGGPLALVQRSGGEVLSPLGEDSTTNREHADGNRAQRAQRKNVPGC